MTHEEYRKKYGAEDHILIRMSDSFPFFKEKLIIENGKERIETNYHIADGMFSRYTNYELQNGALSAETSWTPKFESVHLKEEKRCPVLITNAGKEPFEVDLAGIELPSGYQPITTTGLIHPDEVFAIYPPDDARVTLEQFDEAAIQNYLTKGPGISQGEINSLLNATD